MLQRKPRIQPMSWSLTFVLLTAHAKPTVVDVAMSGDERLTCAQLENEYTTASRLIREAESEKGATGGNVARFLFFWPAIVGTSMNANEAIDAAKSRQVHILNIMRSKNCENLDSLVAKSW